MTEKTLLLKLQKVYLKEYTKRLSREHECKVLSKIDKNYKPYKVSEHDTYIEDMLDRIKQRLETIERLESYWTVEMLKELNTRHYPPNYNKN